jgi:competence ComEA-like helix-hairpin-helix protein
MISLRLLPALLAGLLPFADAAPNSLQTIKDCTFIATEWADGDSFRIKPPEGPEITIRLYGADCVELHVGTDSDKRRLRDQRRYFGITEVQGAAPNPIELAKDYAQQAADLSARLLGNAFTIHTRMTRAPGDGRHERIYAFVETSDGKDLATELVRSGLARARGVATQGPGGQSGDRYKETLKDIELQAAKQGKGIWKSTDWDRLPLERDAQRREEEEDEIAQGNQALPAGFRLDPNTASRDELERLPGIGPKLAEAILEAREDEPFKTPDDLMQVPGIKRKTLEKLLPHLEF